MHSDTSECWEIKSKTAPFSWVRSFMPADDSHQYQVPCRHSVNLKISAYLFWCIVQGLNMVMKEPRLHSNSQNLVMRKFCKSLLIRVWFSSRVPRVRFHIKNIQTYIVQMKLAIQPQFCPLAPLQSMVQTPCPVWTLFLCPNAPISSEPYKTRPVYRLGSWGFGEEVIYDYWRSQRLTTKKYLLPIQL